MKTTCAFVVASVLACVRAAAATNTTEAASPQARKLQACDAQFGAAKWTSERGMILVNGYPFQIRGTNWFGLEMTSPVEVLCGSGDLSILNQRLALIDSQGFNAIRLPVSLGYALNLDQQVFSRGADSQTAGSLIKLILDGAAAHGIVVMLDMHNLVPDNGGPYSPPESWGPLDNLQQGWRNLLSRFGTHNALFAADLWNEPHDAANWGAGGSMDWYAAATSVINNILDTTNFDGLFFVGGVMWSNDFSGVFTKPILAGGNRVVYTPHAYGPGTVSSRYFTQSSFPGNLNAVYDQRWGGVEQQTGRAVVVGEWGGPNNGQDSTWQDWFVRYMVASCVDSFYWTANGIPTRAGGWIDSNNNVISSKMANIINGQPYPSSFLGDLRDGYCLKKGAFANSQCNKGVPAGSGPTPSAPKPAPRPAPKPTHKAPTPRSPTPRSPTPRSPTPRAPTHKAPTPRAGGGCQSKYKQCGGKGWAGGKTCCAGTKCKISNTFYSQCL